MEGHAWLLGGVCGFGGVHGCGGHAWLLGGVFVVAGGCAWLPGGMHGCWGGGMCGWEGMLDWGPCVVAGGMRGCEGGACIGYNEIQSMSGQYASYWNTFLFTNSTKMVF